jgi:hypothetical protein
MRRGITIEFDGCIGIVKAAGGTGIALALLGFVADTL